MTERPTDEQLTEWLYDAEYDSAADPETYGYDFDAHPIPRDTFPPYYEDDYRPTLAVLFRELLELRRALATPMEGSTP